jgi:hypothetical protein
MEFQMLSLHIHSHILQENLGIILWFDLITSNHKRATFYVEKDLLEKLEAFCGEKKG